jgi:hypothetical protein
VELAVKIGFVRFVCVLAVLFFGWGVAVAGVRPGSADEPVPVSIQDNPNFVDMRAQLQAVVNALGFHSTNRFCVVGYETDDVHYPLAYIYWPIQNKMIAWDFGSNQPTTESGKIFDLTRDVLPDGAMTDNYLHRSDIKSIMQDCRKYGNYYTI